MAVLRTKILFVIPSLTGGGAERFLTTLIKNLDRAKFESHLALLDRPSDYLRDLPGDVVVHKIAVGRVRYALPAIVRIAYSVKPKIIFSTLTHMNLGVLLARPLLPRGTKLFVREAISPTTITSNRFLFSLWRSFYRWLYGRADKIVCLSDNMVNEIATQFRMPRNKLVRIYNPVDRERIRQLGEAGASPYSGRRPQLVAVGRLCNQKGFDLLLAAMPTIRRAFPEARLAILGQGALRNELELQARGLGLSEVVSFWGFQQNPWLFIRHADVFVLPSRYEGLPNALLEAMALEKPIVATDCPGAVAEIQDFIPRMALVPMEDPEALARAVVCACTMPAHNGNGNSPGDASSMFGLQTIVGEYTNLFLS